MELLLNLLMLCSIAAGCIGLVWAFLAWARGESDKDWDYLEQQIVREQSRYLAHQLERINSERGL